MKNQKLLIIIDVLAFIAFLISLFSGILMWLVLPSRSGRAALEFLGLARHNWSEIHLYTSLFFAVVILIHLMVHWAWIKNIPRLWKGGN